MRCISVAIEIIKSSKRINRDLISNFNVDIMLGAIIGDNPWINHFSNVVITNFAVIGDNVSIKQGVTIGVKNINGSHYSINIGNNVDIGANACIISDVIKIGNNVTIGAQALVLSDIPDNSIYINKITRFYCRRNSDVVIKRDIHECI